ncbi:hypothetical protein OH491_28090 (plasmid) [Termitidicoccus mucosus]|uniref:hypothetical protein n=1 Tax=Termitidicoccus mucosus TaxID=1184151 RepID=UPI003183EF02
MSESLSRMRGKPSLGRLRKLSIALSSCAGVMRFNSTSRRPSQNGSVALWLRSCIETGGIGAAVCVLARGN